MSHTNQFQTGAVTIGGPDLFLIAGPCVIESEAHARKMADAIQRITFLCLPSTNLHRKMLASRLN